MEQLTISRDNALKCYQSGNSNDRELLTRMFGAEVFEGKLIDQLKTFADVCAKAGVKEEDYAIPEGDDAAKAAAYLKRLQLIEKVFNQGWVADLANTKQNKYYPWFEIKPKADAPGGFRLASSDYGYGSGISFLGVRPYFKDSDTAAYVGKQFLPEFEGWAQYENLAHKARK